MIERDVVQLQYLSGVVRNVFAIGFAPHIPLLTYPNAVLLSRSYQESASGSLGM